MNEYKDYLSEVISGDKICNIIIFSNNIKSWIFRWTRNMYFSNIQQHQIKKSALFYAI